MKRNIALILVFLITLSAKAQSDNIESEYDSLGIQMVRLPDSTGFGTPTGEKVKKEIGPSGGSIVSGDGKLELVFPEGSLPGPTEISIQPVSSVIPNGDRAYLFEPSGIQFTKPVQLVFHYSPEDEERCPLEFKFMALQDHTGKWEYMNFKDWDTAGKTLTGSISHFSIYSAADLLSLTPTNFMAKTGANTAYPVRLNLFRFNIESEDWIDIPILKGNRQVVWKVNNTLGGNQKHGKITGVPGRTIEAVYNAPAMLTLDPVKIRVELNEVVVEHIKTILRGGGWLMDFRRKSRNVATVSCVVTLYDEFKITVAQNLKVEGVEVSDKSTFQLEIGAVTGVAISSIQNELAQAHIKKSRCKAIYYNESTCVGLINVTGIKTSTLTPTEDGLVRANIFFLPAPLVFPVFRFPPCGINRVSSTTPPIAADNAFPMWLKFVATNKKQLVSLAKDVGKVVTKPDPEDIIATIEPIRQ